MGKKNKSAKQPQSEGAQKALEASESQALEQENAEVETVAEQPVEAKAKKEVPFGKFRKFCKGEQA